MTIYTMGFTKKTAETFFTRLKASGARRLVDVRLNNVSQLAGFAKSADLEYFLREICAMEYVHERSLAPTKEMLDSYKKLKGPWDEYEARFLELMRERRIETQLRQELLEDACLLCSEEKPHHCHRRLVAEYLREAWGGVTIRHIP